MACYARPPQSPKLISREKRCVTGSSESRVFLSCAPYQSERRRPCDGGRERRIEEPDDRWRAPCGKPPPRRLLAAWTGHRQRPPPVPRQRNPKTQPGRRIRGRPGSPDRSGGRDARTGVPAHAESHASFTWGRRACGVVRCDPGGESLDVRAGLCSHARTRSRRHRPRRRRRSPQLPPPCGSPPRGRTPCAPP